MRYFFISYQVFAVLVCLEISIFIIWVALSLPSQPFVPFSVPAGMDAALRHPGRCLWWQVLEERE